MAHKKHPAEDRAVKLLKDGLSDQEVAEARRDRDASAAYAAWGTLKGNKTGGCGDAILPPTCGVDKAHLPWAWDEDNDGPPGGLLALDPAFILNDYFNGTVTQNTYSDNWYLTSLLNEGYGPHEIPRGWPAHLEIGDLLAKAPPDQTA